jgi:hypothetical protein
MFRRRIGEEYRRQKVWAAQNIGGKAGGITGRGMFRNTFSERLPLTDDTEEERIERLCSSPLYGFAALVR